MLVRSRRSAGERGSALVRSLGRAFEQAIPALGRRDFLRRAGIGACAGVAAAAGALTLLKSTQRSGAFGTDAGRAATSVETKRTVCSHCSVGCAVDAVVENGVWIRQEPVFDSPINLGGHCAKGAALREHGRGEHRLRYPMKLVNGQYRR